MKYGFIGTGNMAAAIIKGMIKNGFSAEDIFCYDINTSQLEEFCLTNKTIIAQSAEKIIEMADCVVLAVKPNIFPKLLPQISDKLKIHNNLIISIAAGQTIESINEHLGFNAPIARIMPNINATVCESMTAICFNTFVSEEGKAAVRKCFEAVGEIIEIEEESFSIYSAIAGCSPAFTYMYIDSLAKCAHRAGMKKQDAVRIAAQAVLGSAKMLLESGEHPIALADKVCSPGGTTIQGVCSLEENNFQSTVVKAVEASYQKDLSMQK